MEGPTPVSALIHAATMVVAGVYLVARMFPLFIGYAPEVLHWTAYVGAFTAFYAAVVACVQSDIKRVLAFSTISQIGFMLVALGVSADPRRRAGLSPRYSPLHTPVPRPAVPRRGVHHPCRALQRDVGHGRPAPLHAADPLDVPRGVPRHRGDLALERFLLEGRDPDGLLRLLTRHGVGDDRHRGTYGLLHVPALLRCFLGRGESRTACGAQAARGSADDDPAAGVSGGGDLRGGIHPLRGVRVE